MSSMNRSRGGAGTRPTYLTESVWPARVQFARQVTALPLAFRMLRYVTRIWDQYELEHPETRRLPAVIPLVVYHDRSRWTSPLQLLELIDLGLADKQAMQPWLPRFGFLLDDLTCADEDQLLARDLTPPAVVTLLLLKNARGNPAITADLRRWARSCARCSTSPAAARRSSRC
jgi:Putative transposase, YhgA-like